MPQVFHSFCPPKKALWAAIKKPLYIEAAEMNMQYDGQNCDDVSDQGVSMMQIGAWRGLFSKSDESQNVFGI